MADEIIPEKICTSCNTSQPITNYHKGRGKDGKRPRCKVCSSAYATSPAVRARHYIHNLNWKERQGDSLKQKERTRYLDNREKRLESAKRRYRERADEIRAYNKRYYRERTDAIKAAVRVWEKSNPERVRVLRHGTRARRRSAPGKFSREQWLAKCAYWGWRCYLCGSQLTLLTATVDHRRPLSRDGSNWIANIAPACFSCNASKQAMPESEYRQQIQSRNILRHGNLVISTIRF